MNDRGARLTVWMCGLAGLMVVASCLVAAILVYRWFPRLPGTLEARMDLDRLSQVVVPGSAEITLAERGTYAVYYEYRSEVDGVVYAASQIPPALRCSLSSEATGERIAAVPDHVPTNTYTTQYRDRVGVLIQSLTIDEPGAYVFSCHYANGELEPKIVVAVGPNFVWEFFGVAARTFATAAAGLSALVVSGALATALLLVISAKRRSSSRATEADRAALPVGSDAREHQAREDLKQPKLFAWLASLSIILLILSAQLLNKGDSPVLRGAGIVVLGVAGVFIFVPLLLLVQHGKRIKGGTYMRSEVVVDKGLYAITRHPQYLGYMLLSIGFALLVQHWVAFLLAAISLILFYLQAVREEQYLIARFGDAYGRRLRRVPRFNFLLGIMRVLADAGTARK